MFIVHAHNVTQEKDGRSVLARADGTADYDVWVGVNERTVWKGSVSGHVRGDGANLLRQIADRMEK